MDQGLPDVFAVPVGHRVLVHSPRRRLSALLNRPAARLLNQPEPGPLRELAAELHRPLPELPPQAGPLLPCFLGLIPTRGCNGACRYCDFGAGQAAGEVLDARVAVAAVDWMANTAHAAGRRTLDVHFFGGEPFIAAARDTVTAAVHRTRMRSARLQLTPHLEASTNGVCDENTAQWIGDHFQAIVLSLDGPADIHDAHRPLRSGGGSHAQATRTARILAAGATKLCLRACITAHTADRMEEIAAHLAELRPALINFETLSPCADAQAAGLQPPEPFAFVRRLMRARRRLAALGVHIEYAATGGDEPRLTACPLGRDAAIVSPDGTVASCYLLPERWQARGLDLTLGRAGTAGVRVDGDAPERLRGLMLDKPRCQRCFCRWKCAGGCHVEVTPPGCSLDYSPYCVQTRLVHAWELLCAMGRPADADALLADTAQMEALAFNSDDRWNRG